jgi:tetratricopeptide (TPR) repeat protein
MKTAISLIAILLILTSCNVNTSDNSSNKEIDSLFEEKMNSFCDTNLVLNNLKVDSTSQIAQLEFKISWFSDPDDYKENLASARLLQRIDPFNEKAIRHIFRYYESKKIDSIALFFDNLIDQYPKSIEPLLLRSELLFFELENYEDSLYFIEKEKYLIKAFTIDSNDVSVCYNLGELYYKDFLNLSKNKSVLQNSVDKAIKFLNKTIELDSLQLDHLFFPISQLYKFKDNSLNIKLNPLLGVENNCYMPSWYFANLKDNWENDFKTNYIFLIDESSWQSDWIKVQLSALNEPCLYNLVIPENNEVYRFTWLRTFDPPIAVRVVKSFNKCSIYWKIGKGSGGYEPEGIRECGQRELSKDEWTTFQDIFNSVNFDKLPHSDYEPSYDGATWTLERAITNNYKAYNTKEPYKIGKLCMFMIEMTGLKIDEKRIY